MKLQLKLQHSKCQRLKYVYCVHKCGFMSMSLGEWSLNGISSYLNCPTVLYIFITSTMNTIIFLWLRKLLWVLQSLELDFTDLQTNITVLDKRNANLAPKQKELLLWHQKLGMQPLIGLLICSIIPIIGGKPGLLPKHPNILNLCKDTLCSMQSCLCSAQGRHWSCHSL